ncbi:MAG: Flp pilus assembly complex ATPase component TadA [Planctomycetes bacterium]|nr:Flp pilus assembly complex ATPase component TadA [Planctomycetota bacterium]
MTTHLLAGAQPVFLLSVYKPILFTAAVICWGRLIISLDRDLRINFLPREPWNLAQVGAGVAAFLIWLILPFWLGLPLAALIVGGAFIGYAAWRNPRVEEHRRWSFSLSGLTNPLNKVQQARAQHRAVVQVLDVDGKPVQVPPLDAPEYAGHVAIENVLEYALSCQGERFDLATDGQQTAVTVQIDGVKYPQAPLDARVGLSMIDYLKGSAGMDVKDRRRKQTGRVTVLVAEERHTLSLSTQGSTRGLSLTAELNAAGRRKIEFDKLGLLASQKQQLLPALDEPGRVVLVVAPPGQGATTTLYALMSRHDAYTQNLVTLEDQIEHELEGVNQELLDPAWTTEEINQKIKTQVLREAYAMVLSRVADASTAAAVAEYAKTTRFYIGVRQDDGLTALRGWIKAVGDPQKAAGSLAAVVSQRLVRRLCTNCRVAYKPDPEALRRLNLPPDKVSHFYKHSGQIMVRDKTQTCPLCRGLGYRGRVAVFETMVLDDEARALAASGQFDQLRALLRRQKLIMLQEAALMKVVAGETSIGEVSQATREKKP